MQHLLWRKMEMLFASKLIKDYIFFLNVYNKCNSILYFCFLHVCVPTLHILQLGFVGEVSHGQSSSHSLQNWNRHQYIHSTPKHIATYLSYHFYIEGSLSYILYYILFNLKIYRDSKHLYTVLNTEKVQQRKII